MYPRFHNFHLNWKQCMVQSLEFTFEEEEVMEQLDDFRTQADYGEVVKVIGLYCICQNQLQNILSAFSTTSINM